MEALHLSIGRRDGVSPAAALRRRCLSGLSPNTGDFGIVSTLNICVEFYDNGRSGLCKGTTMLGFEPLNSLFLFLLAAFFRICHMCAMAVQKAGIGLTVLPSVLSQSPLPQRQNTDVRLDVVWLWTKRWHLKKRIGLGIYHYGVTLRNKYPNCKHVGADVESKVRTKVLVLILSPLEHSTKSSPEWSFVTLLASPTIPFSALLTAKTLIFAHLFVDFADHLKRQTVANILYTPPNEGPVTTRAGGRSNRREKEQEGGRAEGGRAEEGRAGGRESRGRGTRREIEQKSGRAGGRGSRRKEKEGGRAMGGRGGRKSNWRKTRKKEQSEEEEGG
ncbi:hypothetical protein EGW08_014625 [Elysia chlorotica]|uniref:Uncharacterized protein n=1 Tax=Elysia chlorotica TaxID=188477 RepID=A0A3S1BXS7_ELYCH|nr:hypothetical protein EGW08_014625 [Elysia chlorotica]